MLKSQYILSLIKAPRWKRRLMLLSIDSLNIIACILISSFFRDKTYSVLDYLLILIITLTTFIFTNHYKSLTRYVDTTLIYRLGARNILVLILLLIVFSLFKNDLYIDPKNIFLYFCFLYSSTLSIRFILRDILNRNPYSIKGIKKVAIYGAGSAGAQLYTSLKIANSHEVICFIDDSNYLKNRSINNVPILPPSQIKNYIKDKNIDQILLAIPSLKIFRKKEILRNLYKHNIPVLQVPSIEQIEKGEASINSLRPININDLLGRNSANANPNLLGPGVINKTIFITGAGGSIGSELTLQLLKLNPKKLILLDISEISLYELKEKFITENKYDIDINYVLGSAASTSLIESIFKQNNVDIVFHAAAYKHVPIVEENPIQGLDNNINSTFVIASLSEKYNLEKMILISSDKAVRPTNIMGTSKRLGELIVQAFADKQSSKKSRTCFSIVRFGNVLNSSGSVVPFFEKQIKDGGPLTVTHKEIIRFFMTIDEAAQLVIQSSSLAKGGEVFLLDMGKPISIFNLAKQMVNLSGLTIKDEKNPNGDIEIICTGLRPGEKLYEELLIEEKSERTIHPLIFKANEKFLQYEHLSSELDLLNQLIVRRDLKKIYEKLLVLVPEWKKFEIQNIT